jgi:3D (Asp-Asp-Asp) domain-containing protein
VDSLGKFHWDTKQHRYDFIFGPLGVAKQGGTGITEDGRYISPDWHVDDPQGDVDDFHFVYTAGGACRAQGLVPITGETVAADLNLYPCGTMFMIDEYPGTIFTVADSGGNVQGNHLDIYMGALYYSQYQWLTKTYFKSTVRKVG